MKYDSLRQQRLAGIINEDYRGTVEDTVTETSEDNIEAELQEAIQEDIENLVSEKAENKLSELKLRKHIRQEIKAMLQEMDLDTQDSDWVFSNQRKNSLSKEGQVTMSFLGPGFKK